jgi:hypothetical protein
LRLVDFTQDNYQDNPEYDVAFLPDLENALGRMLDLHQQKLFKNEFYLPLLGFQLLPFFRIKNKIRQK